LVEAASESVVSVGPSSGLPTIERVVRGLAE
jgi:hypothetical protein